jgi:hypothetical protein
MRGSRVMSDSSQNVEEVKPAPLHPTYGTLDRLLATIKADVIQGYELRIGLHGALAWFSYEYGCRRVRDE